MADEEEGGVEWLEHGMLSVNNQSRAMVPMADCGPVTQKTPMLLGLEHIVSI